MLRAGPGQMQGEDGRAGGSCGRLALSFPCLSPVAIAFAFASRGVYHGYVVYKSGEPPLVLLLGHVWAPRWRQFIGC
jgi:hypothetical protein